MNNRNLSINNNKDISKNNYISKNELSHNRYGIFIECTSHNTLSDNLITNNSNIGIRLFKANDVIINKNNIKNNKNGVLIEFSENNTINYNHLIDNKIQAFLLHSYNNNWDFNYWNNWIFSIPKPIFGLKGKFSIIPYLNFDRYPVKEP